MKNIIQVGFLMLVVALVGCTTVTTEDGRKVSKEVYRAENNRAMFETAVLAENKYAEENPIPSLPGYCATRGKMSDVMAVSCALTASNSNMAMMFRDSNRENSAKYAASIITSQARERAADKDRWFRLLGLVYATERNGNGNSGDNGTKITVNGNKAGSNGSASGNQNVNIGVGTGNQTGVDNGSSTGFADDYGSTGSFSPDNSDNSVEEVFIPLEE